MVSMDELFLLSNAGVSLVLEKEAIRDLTPQGKIVEVIVDGEGSIQLINQKGKLGFKYETSNWVNEIKGLECSDPQYDIWASNVMQQECD